VARATERPITAHISAAATIHPLSLFDSIRRTGDSNRLTRGQRAGPAGVTEVDQPGEYAGGAGCVAPYELSAPDGPDVTLGTERAGTVSCGIVGSYSFMMALLLTQTTPQACEPFM
jgi:hypothetical protein